MNFTFCVGARIFSRVASRIFRRYTLSSKKYQSSWFEIIMSIIQLHIDNTYILRHDYNHGNIHFRTLHLTASKSMTKVEIFREFLTMSREYVVNIFTWFLRLWYSEWLWLKVYFPARTSEDEEECETLKQNLWLFFLNMFFFLKNFWEG